MLERRRALTRRIAVAVCVLGTIAPASPALASSTAESRLVSLTNSTRASYGVRPLAVDAGLVVRARRHSAEMASAGRMFHSSSLPPYSGENVAKVHSVDEAHRLFMASASHRANILNAAYTAIGIGVVQRGEWLYITESFQARRTSAHRVSRRSARAVAAPAAPTLHAVRPLVAFRTIDVLREIISLDAGDFRR